MVTTNEFIEQQHAIAHNYNNNLSDYILKKNLTEQSYNEQKQKIQKEQANEESEAKKLLEEVKQVRSSIDREADAYKQKLQYGGRSENALATQNLPFKEQIEICRHSAEQSKKIITDFIHISYSTPSLDRHGAGWIFPLVGILLPILIMLVTQSWGSWLGFFLVFLCIGGGSQLVVNEFQWSARKNAYKTLENAIATAESCYSDHIEFLHKQNQNRLDQIGAQHRLVMQQLEQQWGIKLYELQRSLAAFTQSVYQQGLLGKDWNDSQWGEWQPVQQALPVTRIGSFSFDSLPNFPPVPALIPCPVGGNILFKARSEDRQKYTLTIQSIMLRMLATQAPGKLYFTLIDPVGLGQNVAPFMQLADHYEALVSNKAWAEPRHIEKQLVDLSEHMEMVIQKYLRGQFATIEEYNREAGIISEPYRVLVVIGFPNNFNEEMARRLVSIATNGPKCGVSTIVLLDAEHPPIYGFNSEDLERVSNVIYLNKWTHPDFENMRLLQDTPPSMSWFDYILKKVGEVAKSASKIEVPFSKKAPEMKMWWTGNSQDGLSVPLGPVGATKYQFLELGKGMAHHVLVVGKTGSGKTNLLHVIITGLALNYSPDELELYLVDFKTVGFTAYATYKLPHARVVAIQSEREYSLSVLTKLDVELERRKNLLSKAGVQDIAQYRRLIPQERLPRILLLVDEFQEFFTYDDEVARQASLLLDRLVRQGRAFGMHIMLGSQTLSGSYALARSTIGQMGVRIVLQCEEADSRLALSDDNTEARLLTRTGEAIYNASNGLVGSNNRFQGLLLSEQELEMYLMQLQQFMKQSSLALAWKQTIFDGNKNVPITDSALLNNVLNAPAPVTVPRSVPVWLGEPIAIKDEPTAMQMRSQAGNNLLVVGLQEEAAQGMFIAALLSLTAQYPVGSAFFLLCDLMSSADSPNAGQLERLGLLLEHTVQVVQRRNLPAMISRISSEVERRREVDISSVPSIYLIIYGLQRARDLRPGDDFGLSSFGTDLTTIAPSPAKQFATILREGPELKVHTLAWCDTLSNLNRTLERGIIREFEMRSVFQMSNEDSTNLIDTHVAANLGPHRALLFSEETGRLEKFRPYGLLPESPAQWNNWLQYAAQCINQKRAAQTIR